MLIKNDSPTVQKIACDFCACEIDVIANKFPAQWLYIDTIKTFNGLKLLKIAFEIIGENISATTFLFCSRDCARSKLNTILNLLLESPGVGNTLKNSNHNSKI